jgi:6-phosphogluconolactonase/glucosamine-6-phosphate isomerase/deaminase
MQFILSHGWEEGTADLTADLVSKLSDGQRVLWLVTGGSNIDASVKIMNSISAELSQNLTVLLADERYGEPGHADSNWAQLMAANFDGKQATLLPILRAGDNFEQATKRFGDIVGQAFADNQTIISQMGIGPDGHISGILPDSPATVETSDLVCAYEGGGYQRLTTTFAALKQIDTDYSFAFGESKRRALMQLHDENLSLSVQPSQILKQLSKAYVYNDQIGEAK